MKIGKIAELFGKKPKPEPVKRKYFSQETKQRVRNIQRGRCAHCKRWEYWSYCQFDHIKGKTDNSISNCQMLCLKCHNYKTRQDRIKAEIANQNKVSKQKPRLAKRKSKR